MGMACSVGEGAGPGAAAQCSAPPLKRCPRWPKTAPPPRAGPQSHHRPGRSRPRGTRHSPPPACACSQARGRAQGWAGRRQGAGRAHTRGACTKAAQPGLVTVPACGPRQVGGQHRAEVPGDDTMAPDQATGGRQRTQQCHPPSHLHGIAGELLQRPVLQQLAEQRARAHAGVGLALLAAGPAPAVECLHARDGRWRRWDERACGVRPGGALPGRRGTLDRLRCHERHPFTAARSRGAAPRRSRAPTRPGGRHSAQAALASAAGLPAQAVQASTRTTTSGSLTQCLFVASTQSPPRPAVHAQRSQ